VSKVLFNIQCTSDCLHKATSSLLYQRLALCDRTATLCLQFIYRISNISPEREWHESECQTLGIAGCSFAIFL